MKLIPLTQGKFAEVDDIDFDLVSKKTWFARKWGKTWYAIANTYDAETKKRGSIKMHRFIVNQSDPNIKIDHRDTDGLNNKRNNLREATQAQNLMNRGATSKSTSGMKGVTWNKDRNKWQAQIMANRKNNHLGLFEDKEAAARAYDAAALIHHGEFARLNFPLQQPAEQ